MVSQRSSTFIRSAAALFALSVSVNAYPVEQRDAPGFFTDVLLFDGPAVLGSPSHIQLQTYTYFRQIDLSLGALTPLLGGLFDGIDLGGIGDKAANIVDRLKLFVSIPKSGKEVKVNIPGCGSVQLQTTSSEIDGISDTDITCAQLAATSTPFNAQVDHDGRGLTAQIFPSTPDGFGVISDVDDTIKISNVLDKVKLVLNTFIEEPKAVAGMPGLYKSLQSKLNNPLFSYISGSPFQLQPFLNKFVDDNYPAGPLYLRNLTIFDLPRLVETLTDANNTFKHKTNSIDRLVNLYPQKKWVMIGDSTEQDPEIYAEAFKRHPNSVQCIWIRVVDGANNVATRFATAFANVPAAKFRTFVDADIPALQKLNVNGGQCS